MRVGILGGTFDPVHLGHLKLAQTARQMAGLNRVYFVTSVNPPHKSSCTQANFLDRHGMLALALAGQPELIPSSLEFDRAGRSYTIDTLRAFKQMFPSGTLFFFLIGIDAFLEIGSWKEYRLLPELCHFLVFSRPGFPREELGERLPAGLINQVVPTLLTSEVKIFDFQKIILAEGFECPISSTMIRARIQQGESVEDYVPPLVAEYLRKTGLYRQDSPGN
jgi:nicotinate-nucleotide adenylyltransferase